MKISNNFRFRLTALVLCIIMMLCFTMSFVATASAQTTNINTSIDAGYQVATSTDLSMLLNYTGELSTEQLMDAELPDADIPEPLNVEFVENNGHVNRLRPIEQDLSTIIFQNRNGTYTTYLFSSPVKYVDSSGVIRDKSNALSTVTGNVRFQSEYAYVNQSNDINTYFPANIQSGRGVTLVAPDFTIELSPLSASTTSSLLSSLEATTQAARVSAAQKGRIDDYTSGRQKDSVVYNGVFGDNTSLRYSATYDGFKEDIILYEYGGKNRFSFKLSTNGLRLDSDEFGDLYLSNPLTNEYAASIGRLLVFDSGDHGATSSSSTNHYYEVETIKDNEVYIITAVIDEAFLTSPDTVFPVYIDPEISAFSGSTKNILDAPIYENVYTSQGANYWNIVGMVPDNYGIGRTLMRFPGLSSNTAYTSSNNEILNLKLYLYNSSTNSNSTMITARQYTGTANWSESGVYVSNVAWNSNGTLYSSVPVSTNNAWYEFDLTNAPWNTNSTSLNQGIMLRNSNESNSAYNKTFSSTNRSSQKPYLSFTYRRTDIKNATTILNYTSSQLTALNQYTYNCYGNGAGKQIRTNPSGYYTGQSTSDVYAAVVNDLGGSNNVRPLASINSSIASDEFKVAVKCGSQDYHFIRQLSNGTWYNKSGTTEGLVVSQAIVESSVWYARYMNDGVPTVNYSVSYDDETIYFAVKKTWFS